MSGSTVVVRNVNHPQKRTILDRAHYEAMRIAMLKVIPKRPPGLTPEKVHKAVLPLLPQAVFPDGAGAWWWVKCVQLDLEARRIVGRSATRPLRLTRV